MRQGVKTTLIAVGAGIVGIIIGSASAGSDTGTTAASSSTPATTVTKTVEAAAAPAATSTVTLPAKTVTVKAAPPKPKHAFDDGDWTVGEDFPAGTYRVTANIEGDCYWEITKSGSNGQNIIANDIPAGGRPKVSLKSGEDFSTEGCGTWAKQ